MSDKKFEVHTQDKRFILVGESDSARTSIEVVYFMGRSLIWAKQIDENSCGYCLIQNASNFLSIPHYEGNPELVFAYINSLRGQSDQDFLSRNQNLPTPDMRTYFESKGFRIEEYLGSYDLVDIELRLTQLDFALIYTTTGIHYRGYVPGADGDYYLLDSITDRPQTLDRKSLLQQIKASLGADQSNRHNRVGFVAN